MSYRSDYLDALQAAILTRYRCQSIHRETVFVREGLDERRIVWEGDVEIFQLIGHPEALVCYAWSHLESDDMKIVTVLGSDMVDSPEKAVQAAIFNSVQPLRFPRGRWTLGH
ncbi:MAG TPA: hypothetical protein VFV81_05780 [Verrucomicrobiae bacterium]|nr:hypothetical protein [Verrucomicrobiae bacterium]